MQPFTFYSVLLTKAFKKLALIKIKNLKTLNYKKMKTIIKTASIALIAAISFATNVATAHEVYKVTSLNEIKNFNKISVAGNAEVIIVQSPIESVKVYDDYYAKNALVQEKNGELRISSFEKRPLTVVVYANHLSEINASDDAQIKTSGIFKTIALEVNLKDKAKAIINTETLDLFTSLDDQSSLDLSGEANEFNSLISNSANIKSNIFSAKTSNIQSKNTVITQKRETNNELPESGF